MKKHWLLYIIVGILFGVFDFYYQEVTREMVTSYLSWFVVAWGIWLVPIIPVVLYEAKTSRSKLRSTLASILTWSISVISYYLFMIIKLVFLGQATRPELYIANNQDLYYWSNLASVLLGDVLGGVVEWIGVAVIGGGVVGLLVSSAYLHIRKPSHHVEGTT